MRTVDWSLISFTLFSQAAIGLFLVVFSLYGFSLIKGISFIPRESLIKILLIILGIIIIALMSSVLHLGKPKNAFYAITHFSKSWLSREIIFVILFAVLVCFSVLFTFLSQKNTFLQNIALFVTLIAGILAAYSMSKVYMLETVPAWNTILTPMHFYFTSFTLGGVITLLILSTHIINLGDDFSGVSIVKILSVLIILFVFLNVLAFILNLFILPEIGLAGMKSYSILTEQLSLLFYTKLGLSILSIFFLIYLFLMSEKGYSYYLIWFLCILIIVTEIISRYLFYSSYSRIGI